MPFRVALAGVSPARDSSRIDPIAPSFSPRRADDEHLPLGPEEEALRGGRALRVRLGSEPWSWALRLRSSMVVVEYVE